jgi:hypothetical protein
MTHHSISRNASVRIRTLELGIMSQGLPLFYCGTSKHITTIKNEKIIYSIFNTFFDSFRQALALLTNIKLGWKRLQRNQHSSLLRTFVNYGCETFYKIGPWLMRTLRQYLLRLTYNTTKCNITYMFYLLL